MLLPGQGLRGRLPLISPAFRHSNLRRQVPPRLHDARDPSSERWNYGREYCPVNLSEITTFTPFLGFFCMPKITTWYRRLYFPSEGRRAEDFFDLKNPTVSVGFKPTNLGEARLVLRAYFLNVWPFKISSDFGPRFTRHFLL